MSYPNPKGDGLARGPVDEVPRGMIHWENGEPVASREGVYVRRNTPDQYEPLKSIPSLPGLMAGDQPLHTEQEEPPVFFNSPEWGRS